MGVIWISVYTRMENFHPFARILSLTRGRNLLCSWKLALCHARHTMFSRMIFSRRRRKFSISRDSSHESPTEIVIFPELVPFNSAAFELASCNILNFCNATQVFCQFVLLVIFFIPNSDLWLYTRARTYTHIVQDFLPLFLIRNNAMNTWKKL